MLDGLILEEIKITFTKTTKDYAFKFRDPAVIPWKGMVPKKG